MNRLPATLPGGNGPRATPSKRGGTPSAGRGKPPRWIVGDPAFEADSYCPLMPVWPWGGHRRWAYDLVRFMRPGVIAEIGVHWGTSLFAFAQAVKDGAITSRLIGVDTWQGDNHTGPYGSEVLAMVRRIAADRFPDLRIDLHPMTFDEALSHVDDGSVGLLHIDGFHEYDAVRHDFESWLPKVAPEGVVLLHDVAENTGYGSARFWRELSSRFPSFAFEHSWGLGVVFPKGDRWLRALVKENLADKIALYTYRSRFERATIELRDTGDMAVERLAAMRSMDEMIKQRDDDLAHLKRMMAERTGLMERLCTAATGGGSGPDSQSSTTDGPVEPWVARAVEAVREAREAQARLPDVAARLEEALRQAEGYAAEIAGLRRTTDGLSAELSVSESSRKEVERSLAMAHGRLEELDALSSRLRTELAGLAAEHDGTLARVAGLERREEILSSDLHATMVHAQEQRREADELRRRIEENERMNDTIRTDMNMLAADVEMIALRVEQLERLEIEREGRAAEGQPDGGRPAGSASAVQARGARRA